MSMKMRIFVTGGMVDKEYNEINGELFFKDSRVPHMLKLGRSKIAASIRTLMMIDSRDITDEDRMITVLTSAMVPYTFGSSDELFNLGSSIAFAQTLPHGIYIAMNGRYCHWDNVRKNKKTGEFEEISGHHE